jgi:hypothetical protein
VYNPETGKQAVDDEGNIDISEEEMRAKLWFSRRSSDVPTDRTVVKCMNNGEWAGSYPSLGGGAKGGRRGTAGSTAAAKWTATTRHTKLPDGSERVLYKNPKYPGETRIRKMHKGRDGKMKAAYVKPPKA